MPGRPGTILFGGERRSLRSGLAVSAAAVGIATAAIYPLKSIAPAVSLSVVYLPAVLLVSAYWGLWLGLLTSLLSAAAFNLFHIPPVGSSRSPTVATGLRSRHSSWWRRWSARWRRSPAAAPQRRSGAVVRPTWPRRCRASCCRANRPRPRSARRLGGSQRRWRFHLRASTWAWRKVVIARWRFRCDGSQGEQIATLVVPRGSSAETMTRLRTQVAPSLGALVAIALHRDAVQAEAVETAALRRSDELKTALLRAVSHDLRTPLTAMVTAGHALGSDTLTSDERAATQHRRRRRGRAAVGPDREAV